MVVEFHYIFRFNLVLFVIKYDWLTILIFNLMMKFLYFSGLCLVLITNWFEFINESVSANLIVEFNFNYLMKFNLLFLVQI